MHLVAFETICLQQLGARIINKSIITIMNILHTSIYVKDVKDDYDDDAYYLLSLMLQTLWQRKLLLRKATTITTLPSKIWLLFLLLLDVPLFCNCIGYSYSRFVGPVMGPEEQVFVRNMKSGIGNVDYVAHPKYQFAYGVEDNEQRVLHNRKETRDGDNVHGVYSVVDPDGSLRVVKYTADNANGFQAKVITNGIPVIYGNWQTDLPSVAESDEEYEDETQNEEEEIDEEEHDEYDNTTEVGSSEEDFEEAEEVIEYD